MLVGSESLVDIELQIGVRGIQERDTHEKAHPHLHQKSSETIIAPWAACFGIYPKGMVLACEVLAHRPLKPSCELPNRPGSPRRRPPLLQTNHVRAPASLSR